MLSQESLSSLIGDIYDCALDPTHWAKTLAQINSHMHGAYTAISLTETPNFIGRLMTHTPWDQKAVQSFIRDWGVDRVPGLAAVAYGSVDTPRSTVEDVGEEEFQTSDFYQQWVKPQGLRDACILKYAHTADRIGIVATVTHANRDIVTADERKLMELLSPHLRRAAMIGDLLDHKLVEAQLYQSALDGLKAPILLVNENCRVVYANERAHKLLSSEVSIREKAGELHATNSLMTHSLHDAVKRSLSSGLQLGGRGIAIPVSEPGSPPVVAYVLPLNGGGSEAIRSAFRPATAAIFLSTALTTPPDLKDSLATLYDLTPSEARVAVQIFEGLNPTEAAEQQGVSENTIKTHLSRTFSKMGVTRQAELVKLVTAVTSPIAH
jgi:DNA-binding CsgD family transcriptional regulator/PAS domain-containing protein